MEWLITKLQTVYSYLIFQTLIECLKYITTGDLPPGAKVGGAFIHDPKVNIEEFKKRFFLYAMNLKIRNVSSLFTSVSVDNNF